MLIKELKFIYLNQAQLTISNQTLKEAVVFVLNNPTVPKVEPLCIVFPSTGKQLYFDRNLFEAFVYDELNQEEVIEQTEINGIYRNLSECTGINGICIDDGALWKQKGKLLQLIDDDLYVEAILNDNFEKIV